MKPSRSLGKDGPLLGAIGYGAMGLEGYYGATIENTAVAVIRHALDEGCSLIDTADAYGNGHNEKVLGRAVADRRNEAFIATKFGIVFDPDETGTIDTFGEDDFRNNNPRFQGDNFAANRQRFAPLMELAAELGITAAQLSLVWLLHQGEDIIPIPGTRSRERVTENAQAADIKFDAETLDKISKLAAPGMAQGQTLL